VKQKKVFIEALIERMQGSPSISTSPQKGDGDGDASNS